MKIGSNSINRAVFLEIKKWDVGNLFNLKQDFLGIN